MEIRKALSIGLILVGAFGLAGCPKPDSGPSSQNGATPGTPAAAKLKIAVIPKGSENQFWIAIHAGADAAGKEEGCDIVWDAPNPENDTTQQVNIVNTQTNNKVNAIVLAACDKHALVDPVKKAVAAGIPVVTIDSGIDSDDPVSYIATDNVKGGEAAADSLAKLMGDKGTAGYLIFGRGSVSSDERQKGFETGIAKHTGIKVLPPLQASDVTTAFNSVTNMLASHPEIGGIFAANEPTGIGSAQVLEQKKLAGKIKLVAFDASDKEIEALKAGTIQALVVQDPYQMGYKGVKTAMKAIKKEPVDKKVDSGLTVVTKENMDTSDVQKLLHPK
ncbi:MAG TPA: substrate-binding domain-containing protein [Chthonomonadaceae bacterium]|nr:substrate-binding domain-containing protein [Chthonomonadaceae bacterium]